MAIDDIPGHKSACGKFAISCCNRALALKTAQWAIWGCYANHERSAVLRNVPAAGPQLCKSLPRSPFLDSFRLADKPGAITVPIPEWGKAALDQWTRAARVTDGRIFRAVARAGKVWGKGISQNVVWYVVKGCCERAGLEHIAPHDLRRTCAKLWHDSGGELEQI